MPTTPAPETPAPTDRFRRPTLLDLAVLVASSALVLSVLRREVFFGFPFSWARMATFAAAMTTYLGIVAMPAVLGVQWLVRRRRTMPGVGEWFGLLTSAWWLSYLALNYARISPSAATSWFLVGIPLQWLAAVVAVLTWLLVLLRPGLRGRLRWTDPLGWLTCLATAGYLVVVVDALRHL